MHILRFRFFSIVLMTCAMHQVHAQEYVPEGPPPEDSVTYNSYMNSIGSFPTGARAEQYWRDRDPVADAKNAIEKSDYSLISLIAVAGRPGHTRNQYIVPAVDCVFNLGDFAVVRGLPLSRYSGLGLYRVASTYASSLHYYAARYNYELVSASDFPYSDICKLKSMLKPMGSVVHFTEKDTQAPQKFELTYSGKSDEELDSIDRVLPSRLHAPKIEKPSSFIDFIRTGDLGRVLDYLESGEDFTGQKYTGLGPLQWAALAGHYDIFKAIYENDYFAETKEVSYGSHWRIMQYAVIGGNIDIVQFLLDEDYEFYYERRLVENSINTAPFMNIEVFELLIESKNGFFIRKRGKNLVERMVLGDKRELSEYILKRFVKRAEEGCNYELAQHISENYLNTPK